jgi:hypothetical protein
MQSSKFRLDSHNIFEQRVKVAIYFSFTEVLLFEDEKLLKHCKVHGWLSRVIGIMWRVLFVAVGLR